MLIPCPPGLLFYSIATLITLGIFFMFLSFFFLGGGEAGYPENRQRGVKFVLWIDNARQCRGQPQTDDPSIERPIENSTP